jgi:hypothetical protein
MYAVLRIAKVKMMGHVAGLGLHVERERETRNADEGRRHANERLAGTGDWCADVEHRLADAPIIRKNAVLAIEHVMTASPEFFGEGSVREQARRLADWRDASMAWLRETYGRDNVVAAVLHRDELTPHIQALVVPIDDHGRLNARGFIGGDRGRLSALQDSYHDAVGRLGLERGVRGSVAEHQTVREFYAALKEGPRIAREEIAQAVRVEEPGHVVARPRAFAEEQQAQVVEQVMPVVWTLGMRADELARRVEQQERQITALNQQLERATRDLGALAAQVRQVDLREVIERLGGVRDRQDGHLWRLDGDHINITGERFYNHDRHQGGGGAIDLVMHATGYDFKQAVGWLKHEHGAELAVAAATHHSTRQAQEIAAREARPAFVPPQEDRARWGQVRDYLTDVRALPERVVDELHKEGTLYADGRGNAVFLRRDHEGHTTGAFLRGTDPESDYKGLAAGTRRDAGHFSHTTPATGESWGQRPTLVLAESPIDALSWQAARAQGRQSSGPLTVISTDGVGALPMREIVATQQAGGVVRVATDHDRAGERLWRELSDRYPSEVDFGRLVRERPALKDWNDDLRFPAQAEEVRERERGAARRQEAERRAQEREASRSWAQERQRDGGHDHGGWDHDR